MQQSLEIHFQAAGVQPLDPPLQNLITFQVVFFIFAEK
jgi:hypothetical protein